MRQTLALFFVLSSAFLFCARTDDLAEIRVLMQAKDYGSAIEMLDAVLEKDSRNIEAKELRIRATMLQKSELRNQQPAPVGTPGKKPVGAVSGQQKEGAFSIMSFCGDENTQSITQIQQKLGVKKVN